MNNKLNTAKAPYIKHDSPEVKDELRAIMQIAHLKNTGFDYQQ